MSVMRDDQIGQPPDLARGHVTHLADLVGRGVAYEQGDVDPRHGTIVSANYSLGGEPVLIVHPDTRPRQDPIGRVQAQAVHEPHEMTPDIVRLAADLRHSAQMGRGQSARTGRFCERTET